MALQISMLEEAVQRLHVRLQRHIRALYVLHANGNDEADSTAAGLVFTARPQGSRWSVNVKAGYRFQDEGDGAYGGLEFGYGF